MERLSQEMQAASEAMEFETAARLRDRIRALSAISMEQSINPETVSEADVFALHAEGGQACVQVFFFRAGQNWGNRAYFPRVDRSDEDVDVMNAFLGQFYDDKPIPKLILVNIEPSEKELLTEAFCLKAGGGIGGALPAWILDWSGYVPNVEQTSRALGGIDFGFIWLPAVFYLLAAVPVFFYRRYERLESQVRQELELRRQGAVVSASA